MNRTFASSETFVTPRHQVPEVSETWCSWARRRSRSRSRFARLTRPPAATLRCGRRVTKLLHPCHATTTGLGDLSVAREQSLELAILVRPLNQAASSDSDTRPRCYRPATTVSRPHDRSQRPVAR